MTLIKKEDGTWAQVNGGPVWKGTKAELDTALAAGTLAEGTLVMVTDDYTARTRITEAEYSDTGTTAFAANTMKHYMQLKVPATGRYIAHAKVILQGGTDGTGNLTSIYVSSVSDTSRGNRVIDQRIQAQGIWRFAEGECILTLSEGITLYLNVEVQGQSTTGVEGLLYIEEID